MWRFYGFVYEIVRAIHEMGRFYGFVCLIMLEGGVGLGVGVIVWEFLRGWVELLCDCLGGEKTMSISMCLSGRRMHVWMLTPRIEDTRG